jgi:hypothetical protein
MLGRMHVAGQCLWQQESFAKYIIFSSLKGMYRPRLPSIDTVPVARFHQVGGFRPGKPTFERLSPP